MRVTTRVVMALVSLETGMPAAEIARLRRFRLPARARQLAMWLAPQAAHRPSSASVGRAYGRNHATVLYAARRVTAYMAAEPWWREATQRLLALVAAIERDEPAALAVLATAMQPPAATMLEHYRAFSAACGMPQMARAADSRPPPRDACGRFVRKSLISAVSREIRCETVAMQTAAE